MEWLQQQWEQSNIISGVLSMGIWGAIIYLSIRQVEIPEILYLGGTTVIGFFFGVRKGQQEGEHRVLTRLARIQGSGDRG